MCLEKIRDYLLSKYAPEAVLLHGSRSRGDAADASDYDIVIMTSNAENVHPHEYEGMMLDIGACPLDTRILETGNKVPIWPLEILHDTDGIGKKLCEATRRAYNSGPAPLSDRERGNRASYVKRLIDKIEARGHDTAIRRYYLADFYMRAIRYWFEKRNRWTVSPYRALPIIRDEDAAFYSALQSLWTDSYLSALRKVNKGLFD